MIDDRILGTAGRMATDRRDSFVIGPRAPILIDGFELLERPARRERKPSLTVVSGAAEYNGPPMTIDVTDYREIKAPAGPVKRTDPFLRTVAGPLLAFAAAAVVAIMFSLMP
ncbi:MAG: hypothetical protein JO312_01985, partial [Hyphomicrobiales bacterium]|nr:hypothetical protein [Hyphomicrobiales bacterium]